MEYKFEHQGIEVTVKMVLRNGDPYFKASDDRGITSDLEAETDIATVIWNARTTIGLYFLKQKNVRPAIRCDHIFQYPHIEIRDVVFDENEKAICWLEDGSEEVHRIAPSESDQWIPVGPGFTRNHQLTKDLLRELQRKISRLRYRKDNFATATTALEQYSEAAMQAVDQLLKNWPY